jgi:hypothetical protein
VLPQAFSILAAAIAGVVGGWLFFRLWRSLLPAGRSRAFWTSLPQSVRGMVTTEEPAEVLQHYKELITTIARYSARSIGAVLVAILPAAAIFLLVSALAPPSVLDRNPFSPYLNDLEFWFFVAVTLGSIGAAWWHRRSRSRTA